MKKIKDYYFHKAKKENYLARSVYKLQEINEKYHIIKPGMSVLDLGSSPGSWLQYVSKVIGNLGIAVGIDRNDLKEKIGGNVHFIKEDIFKIDYSKIKSILEYFDVLISDMAPDTTGIKDVDQFRSYELCMKALEIADNTLVKGGFFICKIFFGEDFNNFNMEVKKRFVSTKIFKPKSSRSESKEIYIIGFEKL